MEWLDYESPRNGRWGWKQNENRENLVFSVRRPHRRTRYNKLCVYDKTSPDGSPRCAAVHTTTLWALRDCTRENARPASAATAFCGRIWPTTCGERKRWSAVVYVFFFYTSIRNNTRCVVQDLAHAKSSFAFCVVNVYSRFVRLPTYVVSLLFSTLRKLFVFHPLLVLSRNQVTNQIAPIVFYRKIPIPSLKRIGRLTLIVLRFKKNKTIYHACRHGLVVNILPLYSF